MPLDFHLAKNKNQASFKSPSISLEWTLHKSIFLKKALTNGNYPLFKRIKHFYEDAKNNNNELQNLTKEIEEIKMLFSGNTPILKQLERVIAASKEAQENNLDVWVFCD